MNEFVQSFTTIRPWQGSQHRAFEELAYQLLKDEVPQGVVAIRTGSPDGGVEWYANLPDGSQWGWQAKFILDIDNLLGAMTESVRAVVVERPSLTRLTFVIPWNLSAGTTGGRFKSQHQKYEDKVASWKRNIGGAESITFGLVQGSDLLEKLSLADHRGRRWFWWQQPTFGPEWLSVLQDRQEKTAGEKYRPDLQVDLPISKDLAGLGHAQSLVDQFATLRKRLVKSIRGLRTFNFSDPEIVSAWREILKSVRSVAANLEVDEPFSESLGRFPAVESSIRQILPPLDSLETDCFRLRDSQEGAVDLQMGDRERRDRLNSAIFDIRSLQQSLIAMLNWLEDPATRAASSRLYFLIGPAGSGKTHLLLDSARQALSEGRPAVVLHGLQFEGELWTSICGQLGVPNIGMDVLLGAMDSAANAAGLDSRRLVIMVDAINETPIEGYWERNLPALRAAIEQWPHLSLAVTCRDTYVDVIVPPEERNKYTTSTHPGFAGREVEATQKYFEFYGLEAPRIPLLTPEFTLPLFLRLYCESLARGSCKPSAVGHESRVEIFRRYLDIKVDRVVRRIFPSAHSSLELDRNKARTSEALDALLDGMTQAETEWLSIQDAETIISRALGIDCNRALAVIGAFENEGVLNREPMYFRHGKDGLSVRVVFQAFSDFLLLKRRLDSTSDPIGNVEFKAWLRDQASRGILEAATVVFPEQFGIELPDYLGFDATSLEWQPTTDDRAYRRYNRARHVYQSLAEMLPHRSSSSVTERTVQLLNEGLRSRQLSVSLYYLIYTMAPQPANMLNANGLHRHLARQTMPQRDASFGNDVYHALSEETNSIARLARWAALGPYTKYSPEVVELSAVALIWLLSSSNRYMRDWVTKALVQLLHGHLQVVRNLIEKFWIVNDPYIVQRVIAIAYGCLMRGGNDDRESAQEIATWVRDNVFVPPIRADELMLDSARGIVEWAVVHGCLDSKDLSLTKHPYGLKPPGNPSTLEHIEERFGYHYNLPPNESYNSLYISLFSIGDFGRYVVGSRLHRFSRYRFGQSIPTSSAQEPRLVRGKWNRFLRSLSRGQLAALQRDVGVDSGDQGESRSGTEEASLFDLLTEEQWDLYRSAWTSPKQPPNPAYPSERANRWIFMRTISLGWTPELFGERDRYIYRRDSGRSEHKAERWGKKYQWIAFHELLARIADNYQTWESMNWGDEPEPYDGLHEYTGARDIDPSLPPVNFVDFLERTAENSRTWGLPPFSLPPTNFPKLVFSRYHSDSDALIRDETSRPSALASTKLVDHDGNEWITLESEEVQSERPGDWDSPKLDQTSHIVSYLVEGGSSIADAERLTRYWNSKSYGFYVDGHVDCCYAGEVAWSPRQCDRRNIGWRVIGEGKYAVKVIDAVEGYRWEGNILDCSIEESVSATMPSRFLIELGRLSLCTSGPSWNASGIAVGVYAYNPSFHEVRAHTLYARASWLREFLADHELSLAIVCRTERRLADRDRTYSHPHETVWSAAVFNANGELSPAGIPIVSSGPN